MGHLPFDREWRAAHRGACPLSQFTRYASGGSTVNDRLTRAAGSCILVDDISLLDAEKVDATRLLGSGQVADSYLLALACAHSGQLATFDRRLVTDAVRGGAQGLHLIG